MFNKRGQELSTGTIILLIVGVIILVVLAVGFTGGWGKILPFLATTNVDKVVAACNAVCTENAEDGYCFAKRTLIPNEGAKLVDITCYYLASNELYGVQACNIDCSDKVEYSKTLLANTKYQSNVQESSGLAALCKTKTENFVVQGFVESLSSKTKRQFVSYTCTSKDI